MPLPYVCNIPPLHALKNVFVRAILLLAATVNSQHRFATLVQRTTSVCSEHFATIVSAFFHPSSSPRIRINQYEQASFRWYPLDQVVQHIYQKVLFSSESLLVSVWGVRNNDIHRVVYATSRFDVHTHY